MLTVLLRCVLCCVVCASAQAECLVPDSSLRRAVVRVLGDDGNHASGVIVGDGRVLTAAHVVSSASVLRIAIDDIIYPAALLRLDVEQDIAMLEAPTLDVAPIPLSRRPPQPQQPVWSVGYPRAQAQLATAGVFQRIFRGALQTSAGVDSGQSGGALIACDAGEYVLQGMIRGYGALPDGRGGVERLPNVSLSVAAETLLPFVY